MRDDFPHLLGEMRMVLMPDLKFVCSLCMSDVRFTKPLPEINFPNLNGDISLLILIFFAMPSKLHTI